MKYKFVKYFLFEWNNPIGIENSPYLYRWRIDFYFFSIRLHKWICSDDLRAYHSHPVNFLIFILKEGYCDWRPVLKESKVFNAFSVNVLRRDTLHCVEIKSSPTYTLLFTWGSPHKWAFYDRITMKKKNRDKYFIENKHHVCDN